MILRETGAPQRYEVRDVTLPVSSSSLKFDATKQSLTFGKSNEHRIEVATSPFNMQIFTNDEKVLELNTRGLLNYEHYRDKDAPSDGVELDRAWDESFGGSQDSKPNGPTSVGMDITFVGFEHVYGIPEHTTNLSLPTTKTRSGETISDPYRLYNLDVFEYELNEPMALYGSSPMLIAHNEVRTLSFLWLNPSETWVDLIKDDELPANQNRKNTYSHWFSESGVIEIYIVLAETIQQVYYEYTKLTGRTELPPRFSLGYHQCKWNYKDEQDVLRVNKRFDDENIPYDVIWLDIEHTNGKRYFTWDERLFPDPIRMQRQLKETGRKLVTIVDPHLKKDSGYDVWREANSRNFFISNNQNNRRLLKKNKSDDEPDQEHSYEGGCWPGGSQWPDFTRPDVRDWWADLFAFDKYEGSTEILFIWNDMNEPSVFTGPEVTMHKDALHRRYLASSNQKEQNNDNNGLLGGFFRGNSEEYDYVEHREVHNLYGFYQHMATYHGLKRRTQNEKSQHRPFVLTRSFFIGSQRYSAIWTGDNEATWGQLAIAQPMLLALSLSGYPFVGADVGGFNKHPSPELITRWYQAAVLQPFFRNHAHLDSPRREPWVFGEPYLSHIRDTIVLRYSFLYYLYTSFYTASKTGLPVMRPLFFNYPSDKATFDIQDQYLIGDDILVKPVVTEGERSTSVYLPGTEVWFDLLTQQLYSPSTLSPPVFIFSTPLHYFPIFQRGGSIIARKMRVRRSSTQMANDPFTLQVVLNSTKQSRGLLYLDDGYSYDYQSTASPSYCSLSFDFHSLSLSSTYTSETCLSYSTPEYIERIVIVGLAKEPSKVSLSSIAVSPSTPLAASSLSISSYPTGGSDLSFEYDWRKQILTVRNPLIPITSEWSIAFS